MNNEVIKTAGFSNKAIELRNSLANKVGDFGLKLENSFRDKYQKQGQQSITKFDNVTGNLGLYIRKNPVKVTNYGLAGIAGLGVGGIGYAVTPTTKIKTPGISEDTKEAPGISKDLKDFIKQTSSGWPKPTKPPVGAKF